MIHLISLPYFKSLSQFSYVPTGIHTYLRWHRIYMGIDVYKYRYTYPTCRLLLKAIYPTSTVSDPRSFKRNKLRRNAAWRNCPPVWSWGHAYKSKARSITQRSLEGQYLPYFSRFSVFPEDIFILEGRKVAGVWTLRVNLNVNQISLPFHVRYIRHPSSSFLCYSRDLIF